MDEQRAESASTLHFTRDLIALRRELPALRSGRYAEISAPQGAWAWRRGDDVLVAVNLALSTNRNRDAEIVTGDLALAPSEGVIIVLRDGHASSSSSGV